MRLHYSISLHYTVVGCVSVLSAVVVVVVVVVVVLFTPSLNRQKMSVFKQENIHMFGFATLLNNYIIALFHSTLHLTVIVRSKA